MLLFNLFLVVTTFFLGLLAALYMGAAVYLDDEREEERQEMLFLAKLGFVITMSVMMVLHVVGNLIT